MHAATHLIAANHGTTPQPVTQTGTCCFCATEHPGLPAAEVISDDYFSDGDQMHSNTGHVCAACAYCMTADRSLKNGHWIAASNRYEQIATSDLPEAFDDIRDGVYEPPLAVHLTASPIRSQHAYLWTPVTERTDPFTIDFDRQSVHIEWETFDDLLAAVEDYRWHGARLDDIRSGEFQVVTLDSLGIGAYRRLERAVDPHRGTPLLEVALTLSRSADDQDRDETPAGNTTFGKYA